MKELLAKAKLAVGAGGVNTLERIAVGVPSVVITTADNQLPSIKQLHKNGVVLWVGHFNEVSDRDICLTIERTIQDLGKIKKRILKEKKMISNEGKRALASFLNIKSDSSSLNLREATLDDCFLYWKWVNDKNTRANSFNSSKISIKKHESWYQEQLNRADAILLVATSSLGPFGQVRFNKHDNFYKLDYSIDKKFRGFGLAKLMLIKALKLLGQLSSGTVIAQVKRSNFVSNTVLQQVGFVETYSSVDNIHINYLFKLVKHNK